VDGIGIIADRLRRSAVSIQAGAQAGSGSGVVWNAAGLIVTNAHVARGKDATVELWTGRRHPARLLAQDTRRDLAMLRIDAPPEELEPASIARADALRPGEIVIAVGNPLGFQGAVSRGVVHTVGPVRGLGGLAWVQADIRLAPGNSGGPLADAQGRVVGINSMIAGGVGLAVPAEAVERFVRYGASQATLGVTVQPVRSRRTSGLLVLDVVDNSPAARASLLLGDVLTSVNGQALRTYEQLRETLESGARQLTLGFLRGAGDRPREVTVQLRAAEAA